MADWKNVPFRSDLHGKMKSYAGKCGMTITGLANRVMTDFFSKHEKNFGLAFQKKRIQKRPKKEVVK